MKNSKRPERASPKKKLPIDLNLDAGEFQTEDTKQREIGLYPYVTSLSIACGGHTGDETTMTQVLEIAGPMGLRLGAHPSYPDASGFGRKKMNISPDELENSIRHQIERLSTICEKQQLQLSFVKPHGALYNVAANDTDTAAAIIRAVQSINPQLAICGLAGSHFLKMAASHGFKVLHEAFIDRAYERDGSLRSRHLAGALISDPLKAANQALSITRQQRVQCFTGEWIEVSADTLCLHSDTANSLELAKAVHQILLTETSH